MSVPHHVPPPVSHQVPSHPLPAPPLLIQPIAASASSHRPVCHSVTDVAGVVATAPGPMPDLWRRSLILEGYDHGVPCVPLVGGVVLMDCILRIGIFFSDELSCSMSR
jgi:hypothetical protein